MSSPKSATRAAAMAGDIDLLASSVVAGQRSAGLNDSFEDAKRQLTEWRETMAAPLPKLESMTRAQVHLQRLRELTKSLTAVLPKGPGTAGGGGGVPPLRAIAAKKEDPIVPDDKEAFLQQLHRSAVPDDDLRERYERMKKFEQVKGLHLSFQSTPPQGEYKGLLQAKTDAFESNFTRFEKLSALTPRSLARQKRFAGGSSVGSPGQAPPSARKEDGDEEEPKEDDAAKPSTLRSMASTLAETDTKDLLEKTIVMQTTKHEFQGNLSLKRAVQLAMAAQHAQQLEDMKRTFEQRLHEAVSAAKDEGMALGRKEGAESSQVQLEQQSAKIQELTASVARLQKLAESTFAEKESTYTKVSFVRDEREKWHSLALRFEDMNVDELARRVMMYEEERDFLYKRAFRTDAEMEQIVFKSPKRLVLHASTDPPAAGSEKAEDRRKSIPRSKKQTVEARHYARKRVNVMMRYHERLSAMMMKMCDVDAGPRGDHVASLAHDH